MEKKSKHKTDTANPTKKKVAVEVVESVESELFKSVRAILAKARDCLHRRQYGDGRGVLECRARNR